jgi:hypothetical protein
VVNSLSEEDFSLAVSLIGFFVGLAPRRRPMQVFRSDPWDAI